MRFFFIWLTFTFLFVNTLFSNTVDSIFYYKKNNQIYKAINFTKNEINKFEKLKNEQKKSKALFELALLFKQLNDNKNALKCLFEAKINAEKNKLTYLLYKINFEKSRIYNNILNQINL